MEVKGKANTLKLDAKPQLITEGPYTGLVFWTDGYYVEEDCDNPIVLYSWREILRIIRDKICS